MSKLINVAQEIFQHIWSDSCFSRESQGSDGKRLRALLCVSVCVLDKDSEVTVWISL